MRTLSRILVCASVVGLLLAVATPAWAPEAPNPGFEQGWRSGEADAQRRHELELQRRQFEYERLLEQERAANERRLEWERTARTRGPSRNQKLNEDVLICGNRAGLRVYAWDWPDGSAHLAWWNPTPENLPAFEDCLVSSGWPRFQEWRAGRAPR